MSPQPPILPARHPRGSALPDLLVVVGVIALLFAITIPMLLSARTRSARVKCANNMREIASAMSQYAHDNQRKLPSTRPTSGPSVMPDVSNSGKDSPDPFGLAGPKPNSVPAVLFLLLRTQELPAWRMICPGTQDTADTFEGHTPRQRSNFTDIQHNLSYAVQNPYADDAAKKAGFKWTLDLPPDFVILADKGPGGLDVGRLSRNSPMDVLRLANSPNHEKQGQNVLYADGRVEFLTTPLAGVDGDNIYVTQAGSRLASPRSSTDTILLPTRHE
jgi:type II secretory pathway pseudopilin PulG